MSLCPLCQQRPPRRICPALSNQICARCCGEERERTIQCPWECEHLMEARAHEPRNRLPEALPNREFRVDESFIQKNSGLVQTLVSTVYFSADQTQAVDLDVREVLQSVIAERLGSEAPVAREMVDREMVDRKPVEREPVKRETAKPMLTAVLGRMERFQLAAKADGVHFPEEDITMVLVFMQRQEYLFNNQRALGRAFLQLLQLQIVSHMASSGYDIERLE